MLARRSRAPVLTRNARAAEKWRHAIVASKGDAAFFFMAQKKGFFASRYRGITP